MKQQFLRENIFINYLDIVGYNAEPVLLTHEPNSSLDKLFVEITKTDLNMSIQPLMK